jgi:hypothetical protein
MKRKRLTMEQAKINLAQSAGARQRELNARFLLLHLDQLSQTSLEDLAALSEYVGKEPGNRFVAATAACICC